MWFISILLFPANLTMKALKFLVALACGIMIVIFNLGVKDVKLPFRRKRLF